MKALTKYFGEIEYDEGLVLRFSEGIYGFEEEHEFLFLPFEGREGGLFCLQSLSTESLAFVLIDPFMLTESYEPVLQGEELKALGAEKSEDLFYYTMCAASEPVEESVVNLKCPIAVNGDTNQAMQVILESDKYQMRHKLKEFSVQEGDGPC